MEYKLRTGLVAPRLIIHGGAGNITPENLPPERYNEFREALLAIVTKTHAYMTTPAAPVTKKSPARLPNALETAVHAVLQLEDNPLFNAGHGAVFTRDGINELEASVMVSRGHAKRGVGVAGLRHVRNPILLAQRILEHGDEDLGQLSSAGGSGLDVPSAQGHTLLFGKSAEVLARDKYQLEMVEPDYFFTQRRWDEHISGLQREQESAGRESASWSAKEYVPQGTVGAVALDSNGVICVATSTGGITNKLTGRIGDTPSPGAGFWAEEWAENGDPTGSHESWLQKLTLPGPALQLSSALQGLLADCLPTPLLHTPLSVKPTSSITTIRSFAGSGTGNGDSFMRVGALRTVAAMARFKPVSSAYALSAMAGPSGELQRSTGNRWGLKGEGEGGIIGIECAIVTDDRGHIVESRSEILHDHNCGGMFRAWIDDNGGAHFKLFLESSGAST